MQAVALTAAKGQRVVVGLQGAALVGFGCLVGRVLEDLRQAGAELQAHLRKEEDALHAGHHSAKVDFPGVLLQKAAATT